VHGRRPHSHGCRAGVRPVGPNGACGGMKSAMTSPVAMRGDGDRSDPPGAGGS
jgi:hypothetical protein